MLSAGTASKSNPPPSSSTMAVDRSVASHEQDADFARFRMLDDVRQRLLDDAVDGRLDLGRQSHVADSRFELHPEPRGLGKRLREPF
jgi:hypothetical protein